jgi:hypothetical protein
LTNAQAKSKKESTEWSTYADDAIGKKVQVVLILY